MITCSICLDETQKNIGFKCKHKFCLKCIKTYVELELTKFNIEIKCPNYESCKHVLDKSELGVFISSKELLDKYNEIKQNKFIDALNIFYCRCGEAYEIEGKSKDEKTIIFCSKCQRESCSRCSLPPHRGECVRVTPDQIELVEKGIIKHCPKCRFPIEKNKGCDHMKCKCGHEFYWSNLETFNPLKVPDRGMPPDNLNQRLGRQRLSMFPNTGDALFNDSLSVFDDVFRNTSNSFQTSREAHRQEQKERFKFVPPIAPKPRIPIRIIQTQNGVVKREPVIQFQETKNVSTVLPIDPINAISLPKNKKELIDLYKTDRKYFDKLCLDRSIGKTGMLFDSMRIDTLAKTMNLN